MQRIRRFTVMFGSAVLLAQLMAVSAAWAGDPAKEQASDQMKWGYQAARRGYWLEALDRFERANDLTPGQPRILNNIAVALEASGRFEEAKLAYQTALAVAPNDRTLRRNFAQFKEFYDTQVATEEPDVPGDSDDQDESPGADVASGKGGSDDE